jgi:hypothetical protein
LIVGNLGYANKLKLTVGICGGTAMQLCSGLTSARGCSGVAATRRKRRSDGIGKIEELRYGGHGKQMEGRSRFVKKMMSL